MFLISLIGFRITSNGECSTHKALNFGVISALDLPGVQVAQRRNSIRSAKERVNLVGFL